MNAISKVHSQETDAKSEALSKILWRMQCMLQRVNSCDVELAVRMYLTASKQCLSLVAVNFLTLRWAGQ